MDRTKGGQGFPLRAPLLGAGGHPLRNCVFQVRAEFVPNLIAFRVWQSRHCLAQKAFRFRL